MAGTLGIVDKKYVSSVNFLDQREILNKILDITNEESSFLDVMELTGRATPTAVPTYHHFVNEELYVIGTVSAVSGSGSTQVTATVDSTAYNATNKGELVLFPAKEVGIVVNKSGSELVIKSVDATNLTLVATNKLAFFSNAAGEGSGSPDSKRWNPTKYYNQVQIFKQKYEITDIQKASKVEVDFNGKPYYMLKGQHESLMKFRGDISAAMIAGKMSVTQFSDANPSLVDTDGNAIQTTAGLDQYVTSYGILKSLLTAGELNLEDMESLVQSLSAERAPKEYFLFVGTSKNILFDNFFNSLGNGAILSQAARFDVGKNLDLGIDSVKIYGYTFHKKLLPILDHKRIFNFAGSSAFKDYAYGAPATKQKTVDGQMVDRIGVRYMAGDGLDLKYREILLGGLAPVPTNEKSVLEVHYSSVQGLEILGANHFFRLA